MNLLEFIEKIAFFSRRVLFWSSCKVFDNGIKITRNKSYTTIDNVHFKETQHLFRVKLSIRMFSRTINNQTYKVSHHLFEKL